MSLDEGKLLEIYTELEFKAWTEELKNKRLAWILEDIEIDKQFYAMAINNLFGWIKACEDVLDGDVSKLIDEIHLFINTEKLKEAGEV